MAYPQPPGSNSLPARPPPPANSSNRSGFKPAFQPSASQQPQSYARNAPSYGPSYGAPPQSSSSGGSYGPSAFPSYSSPAVNAPPQPPAYSYPQQQSQQYQPQSYGPQSQGAQASGYAAPQIKNPFALTGPGGASAMGAPGGDFDPEMAAQIAQWQSAYVSKDAVTKDGKPIEAAPRPEIAAAVAANATSDKKKTVVREGGGKKWTDESLLEWDPTHLRLFVGNLAGETTDESLLKAFSRWKTVQKARVIRDKRTTKSKGYGFVSFTDADDFFQAAKEMNGKYIQSHPVTVRKANTEIKVTNVKEKERGGKRNNNKKNNKSGHGGGDSGYGGAGYDPQMGPMGGAGVTKPGQKTKNGLRLLG